MRTIFERRGFALTSNGVGGLRASIGAGHPLGLGVELSAADAAELVRSIQEWLWSEPVRAHLAEHARLSAVENAARVIP